MPFVNNAKKGVNSGTTVQKTLKLEATTYFARVDVGSAGSATLVESGGQSKGVLAFIDPDGQQESGSFTFLYEPQVAWLGSPSISVVSGNINTAPVDGDYWTAMVRVMTPSYDVSPFNIEGVSKAAVVSFTTYHISGSQVSEKANPPSGSSIYLTLVGTQSPVF